MPAAALAQSTGSVDFEKDTIVVTGTRTRDVGGVQAPDTPKAKAVLTQEIIARQNPGQTILDTINLVPGVSFQNNDAYGSSGGTLNIRGFSSDRISLTFDGIQLNDSGNYAIYSNQQLDPELIEQVNVTLGSTDVDSPTASATGGTVNYRTILPRTDFGGRAVVSLGEFNFRRVFGVLHTGEIGPWGTRAFASASTAKNDNPFNNYGKVDKQQYNARIYQPIGNNGDFVSVSGHYNENRNNFFGSVRLRDDLPTPNGFPDDADDRKYDINFPCRVDVPQAGVADGTNGCGTEFDRRFNPSNTGNIRGASRFTLAEGVVLTVDPSYQYVKANGGGTVNGFEGLRDINPADPDGAGPLPATATTALCAVTPNDAFNACVPGFLGGSAYFGRDINGDGDTLDTVSVLAPSQTKTNRYGVIAGLRWDINPDHTVRVSYTLDDAHHRQTGEVGLLESNGEPEDVYPVNDPEADALGVNLQKRDRKSVATLNQVAGEYRGEFFDDRLTVNLGLRAPFFVRKLQNFCFTSSASGFVECFGQDSTRNAAFAALNPNIQGPQKRKFKYDKLLPNLGAVYDITSSISAFASYSKGLSVPSTDNLYNSFFFAPDTDEAKPEPETTDSFDGGLRYRSSKIQAQASVWLTKFKNRSASAYDPELNASVFRNLGSVDKWGIDGSVAYKPLRDLTFIAFGSWNQSKIKDDIQVGQLPLVDPLDPTGPRKTCDDPTLNVAQQLRGCAFTSGKRESGSPKYTYGFSALGSIGPFDLGITAKRTGPRFIFDTNEPVLAGDVDVPAGVTQLFSAKAPAYWLVNLDARYNLAHIGPELADTYFQLNVYNLFNETYVGGFGGGLNQTVSSSGFYASAPFVQIGAPRTISGTLNIGF